MNISQEQDDQLRRAYQLYSVDHDRHREALMDRIAQETVQSMDSESAARTNRHYLQFIASLAAVLLVAFVMGALLLSPQSRVYAMEGISDRLLELRSLYLRGDLQRQIVDVDGKSVTKSFPIEYYLQRPNRFRMNVYGFSDSGDNTPTQVREIIKWVDDGIAGTMNVGDGKITLKEIEPRLSELDVEHRVQVQSYLEILTNATHDFVKIGSETRDGVRLDLYEKNTLSLDDTTHKCQVWLNPATGLPARIRYVNVDGQGKQHESMLIDTIEINQDDSKDLFPSIAGQPVQPATNELQPIQSAGSDRIWLEQWYALQVSPHQVFACWSFKLSDSEQTSDVPQFIGSMGEAQVVLPAKIIHEFNLGDRAWKWSLIDIPDGLKLDATTLDLRLASGGTTASLNIKPLKFPADRLETVLKNAQNLLAERLVLPALSLQELLKR